MQLSNILEQYRNSGSARFHMPGHAGKTFGSLLDDVYPYDVTELAFTDDLHHPEEEGPFAELELYFRSVTAAQDVLLSCAGSTAMLQTAVTAALRRKKGVVLCERAVHISIVYALSHCNAEVRWMTEPARELEGLLHTEISCVIVVSPDYYGKMHDIRKLSALCKSVEIPLIVDAAHGAHLEFYRNGALSPCTNGAALTAESLHKTLPCLTGAAMLLSDGTFTREELLAARRRYASSSPSYLISLSIAEAVQFMRRGGTASLESLACNMQEVRWALGTLGFHAEPESALTDPFRLYIRPGNRMTPQEFASILSENGVICEFYDCRGVILIPSVLHTKEDLDRLLEACRAAQKKKHTERESFGKTAIVPLCLPQVQMTLREALFQPYEMVAASDACGRVCAEPVYLYPPGVPLVMPGEVFDEQSIAYLGRLAIAKVSVTAK